MVITSFCAHSFSNPDMHYEAFVNTVAVKTKADIKFLCSNPSFWKIKIALFHMFEFPKYIAHRMSHTIIDEASILAWGIIIPDTAAMNALIHLSCITALIAKLILGQLFIIMFMQTSTNNKMILIYRHNHRPSMTPLPRSLMVLSTVMLYMAFVGELTKRGLRWTPFNDILVKYGKASCARTIVLRKHCHRRIIRRIEILHCLLLAIGIIPAVMAQRVWKYRSTPHQSPWQPQTPPMANLIPLGDLRGGSAINGDPPVLEERNPVQTLTVSSSTNLQEQHHNVILNSPQSLVEKTFEAKRDTHRHLCALSTSPESPVPKLDTTGSRSNELDPSARIDSNPKARRHIACFQGHFTSKHIQQSHRAWKCMFRAIHQPILAITDTFTPRFRKLKLESNQQPSSSLDGYSPQLSCQHTSASQPLLALTKQFQRTTIQTLTFHPAISIIHLGSPALRFASSLILLY